MNPKTATSAEIKQLVDFVNLENYAEVERFARLLVEKYPEFGFGWKMLSGALIIQEKDPMHALQKVTEFFPDDALAHGKLGTILEDQGRLDEARIAFETAVRLNPDFIEAHYSLSALKTYFDSDPHVNALERQREKINDVALETQINYWFTIGKMREDLGQYYDSFSAYEMGNQLQFGKTSADVEESDELQDKLLGSIVKVFSKKFFENMSKTSGDERTPIFIVGMPRSGTSLLEQILASCSGVFGAGELSDLSQAIATLPADMMNRFPYSFNELAQGDFQRLGKHYLDRVWQYAPSATHIVDKNFANFFYLGIIHLIFPNAKIIHAMRDPMDSCFSCYSRIFSHHRMRFTCDLTALGRYYVRYAKLMQHWHDVLPTGAILDMRYEEMVSNTEKEARRLLSYLEIPWDEQCLAFHQNKRRVVTASASQVRKPIYKTSVARWRPYDAHLSPLMDQITDWRCQYWGLNGNNG